MTAISPLLHALAPSCSQWDCRVELGPWMVKVEMGTGESRKPVSQGVEWGLHTEVLPFLSIATLWERRATNLLPGITAPFPVYPQPPAFLGVSNGLACPTILKTKAHSYPQPSGPCTSLSPRLSSPTSH